MRIGLTNPDCSISQTSFMRAQEFMMTGKKLNAKQAKSWGLVDLTVEPLGERRRVCERRRLILRSVDSLP